MRYYDLKGICKHLKLDENTNPLTRGFPICLCLLAKDSVCSEDRCPFIDEVAAGIYTVQEVSRYLRTSKSNIYEYARKGILPGRKIGKQWRFHKEALDAWLKREDEQCLKI